MKYIKIGFISIFIVFIAAFFVMTIDNDNSVSWVEKRELQVFPEFSVDKLADEEYYDQLTTAFSDQLEYRDLLVKGYYLFQFQRYNGDVVIGENNELYSAYQRVDEATYLSEVSSAAGYVNSVSAEISDAGAEFIFLSIPRKDAVETKNLPDSYISSEDLYLKSVGVLKENLSDNVKLIDAYEIFSKDKDIRYYYTTDHHITPRAAFKLYHEILRCTTVPDYDVENYYDIKKTIIKGSFNDQIGQSVKSKPEELALEPHDMVEYERYEDDESSKQKVFQTSNTYENCYMEGDQAYTVIDTGRDYLPNIMYVGSSFTNIMEAITIRDFNLMVSIDYRDNDTGTSIVEYVRKHDIDYVIYVPSQSNDALGYWKMLEHLGY